MGQLPADVRSLRATLVERRDCGPDAFLVEIAFSEAFSELAPGRFAMLSPAADPEFVVPRPFSVLEQPSPERMRFLIQVIGRGTRALAALEPGAELRCTVPLGNGFALPSSEREVVLVAGGVGCAPFLLYGRQRARQGAGSRTVFLYGAREAARLYAIELFEAVDWRLLPATDDGSRGFHGNAVSCLGAELEAGRIARGALYCACGPAPFLHAFSAFAREHGLDARLSLETYMGCGIGVCNGCPTATAPDGAFGDWPWAKACLDGPVFALRDLADPGPRRDASRPQRGPS